MGVISTFLDDQFKHFNARETLDAARAWRRLLEQGGEMFLTLGGAMSSAELGISLAAMIRQGKVHGICATAANLEEDIFNLLGRNEYEMIPDYRDLRPQDELALRDRGVNRVTDTGIPEDVMRTAEEGLLTLWQDAAQRGESKFFWEYMYELLDSPDVRQGFQVPEEHSWVLAAKECRVPIYTPGWEDSTMGNVFCARVMLGDLPAHNAVRTGTEQMQSLAEWYMERAGHSTPVGFFQIGGGIAGDFPICVVPMLLKDLKRSIPFWAYFAQIGDSTTSYGSYSGAVPNEKITWFKLAPETPRFMINSDATIVAPLIFAYVLGE